MHKKDYLKDLQPEDLSGIYKDIASDFGIEIALMIFNQYKGLQVTFPTRFISKEYVSKQVIREYKGDNSKELSRKYDYSERWIRKMLEEKNKGT